MVSASFRPVLTKSILHSSCKSSRPRVKHLSHSRSLPLRWILRIFPSLCFAVASPFFGRLPEIRIKNRELCQKTGHERCAAQLVHVVIAHLDQLPLRLGWPSWLVMLQSEYCCSVETVMVGVKWGIHPGPWLRCLEDLRVQKVQVLLCTRGPTD